MKRKFNKTYSVVEDETKTKSKIILCALRLFALHGYDTVSMKQIAAGLEIQPAAIYNHYPSKEDILNAILDQTSEILDTYYHLVEEANLQASSFREIVDNMYAELLNITTEFVYYGLTIAQYTQFSFEKSRKLYCDKYIIYGHEVMKRQFDIAVEKGFICPFDTRAVASLYGGTTIAMVPIHAGKFNGYYEKFDPSGWYRMQKQFILDYADRLK